MPKLGSHGTERNRTFSGEEECRELIAWLNTPGNQHGRKKVREILALYGELKGSGTKKKMEKLQRLLRRYAFYPMLLPLGPVISIHWFPAIKLKKYSDGWGPVYDDANAIFDLAQLAHIGLTDRIQKCRCSAWFFAKFKHQRFCSARCRETEFRSSAEWKEYRRKKAREYYRLHKTKNVR